MSQVYQYMVNFVLLEDPPEEFFDLVPYQEVVVEQYLTTGKLVNYAQSMEFGQCWAVFKANSEMEVLEMLIDFPLTEFMEVEINLLAAYQTLEHPVPDFSLN